MFYMVGTTLGVGNTPILHANCLTEFRNFIFAQSQILFMEFRLLVCDKFR